MYLSSSRKLKLFLSIFVFFVLIFIFSATSIDTRDKGSDLIKEYSYKNIFLESWYNNIVEKYRTESDISSSKLSDSQTEIHKFAYSFYRGLLDIRDLIVVNVYLTCEVPISNGISRVWTIKECIKRIDLNLNTGVLIDGLGSPKKNFGSPSLSSKNVCSEGLFRNFHTYFVSILINNYINSYNDKISESGVRVLDSNTSFNVYSKSIKENILDESFRDKWNDIDVSYIYLLDLENEKILFYPSFNSKSFEDYNFRNRPWWDYIKKSEGRFRDIEFGITPPYIDVEKSLLRFNLVRTVWHKFSYEGSKYYLLMDTFYNKREFSNSNLGSEVLKYNDSFFLKNVFVVLLIILFSLSIHFDLEFLNIALEKLQLLFSRFYDLVKSIVSKIVK